MSPAEGESEALEPTLRARRRSARPAAVRARLAARTSLLVSLLVLGTKLAAWWVSGSAALLADALESLVNVAAAGFASYTVALSARPPDEDHPYGHGKAEFLSAALEGALILVAATLIVAESLQRLLQGAELARLGLGAALGAAGAALNAALGVYLLRAGRAADSPALLADGRHVLADVVTTLGALLGLAAVALTGVSALDPLAAIAVAGYIVWTGWRLVRGALGGLLDEADFQFLQRIAQRLRAHRAAEWIEIHELRTWRSGSFRHIDLHVVMPRYWTIEEGHRRGQPLEDALLDLAGGHGDVALHIDPCRPELCAGCAVAPCPVRTAAFGRQRELSVAELTREGCE